MAVPMLEVPDHALLRIYRGYGAEQILQAECNDRTLERLLLLNFFIDSQYIKPIYIPINLIVKNIYFL